MTEQQIDAEVSRYEPARLPDGGRYCWCRFDQDGHQVGPRSPTAMLPHVLPSELFDALAGGTHTPADFDADEMAARDYPTREAAFADLRRAIAAGSK